MFEFRQQISTMYVQNIDQPILCNKKVTCYSIWIMPIYIISVWDNVHRKLMFDNFPGQQNCQVCPPLNMHRIRCNNIWFLKLIHLWHLSFCINRYKRQWIMSHRYLPSVWLYAYKSHEMDQYWHIHLQTIIKKIKTHV